MTEEGRNREQGRSQVVPPITHETLNNWFTYHAPSPADNEKYKQLRAAGFALAETILDNTPSGPDQTAAIRKVREAVMTANQAIACEPKSDAASAR